MIGPCVRDQRGNKRGSQSLEDSAEINRAWNIFAIADFFQRKLEAVPKQLQVLAFEYLIQGLERFS